MGIRPPGMWVLDGGEQDPDTPVCGYWIGDVQDPRPLGMWVLDVGCGGPQTHGYARDDGGGAGPQTPRCVGVGWGMCRTSDPRVDGRQTPGNLGAG